jgi:4'-phosphopantetheinyl transferase
VGFDQLRHPKCRIGSESIARQVSPTIQNRPEFVLCDGEVHVWSASLDVPIAFTQRQWLMLSEEEKHRAQRFLFAGGRTHYVCGRSILRILLGRYLNVAPKEVVFRYGPNSKPELAPPFHHGRLHFNVSHSNGQLLVAIARGLAVGVDIEMVRPEMEIDSIAKRFFSFDEIEQLGTLSGSAKCDGFFNVWTRKEAYLKARSEGIGYGLDQFAVSLDPDEPARLLSDRRDPGAVRHWGIHALAASSGYAAALSAEALDFSVEQLSLDAILFADQGHI